MSEILEIDGSEVTIDGENIGFGIPAPPREGPQINVAAISAVVSVPANPVMKVAALTIITLQGKYIGPKIPVRLPCQPYCLPLYTLKIRKEWSYE